MINAADMEFHDRDPEDMSWAETIVLIFNVPEAKILGNAYILARPNLGVVASSVVVYSGFDPWPHKIDFLDPRMHLPCPESFLDMKLDSGLHLQATNAPRDWRMTYQDTHGACSFDLLFEATHDPFDTHEPEHNPLLAQGKDDMGYGDAWATGHMDAIGHVTGDLELRGKRYTVDCYEGMDRSWGPREEYGGRAVCWVHIPFGEEFGLHAAMALDFRDGQIVYDAMRFGYVQENGVMTGLVDCEMEADRVDMCAINNTVRATDAKGRTWEFRGTAVASSPWYQFIPAYVCYHTLMRYEWNGMVTHAEHGDIFGMDWLGDRLSRHARIR